MNEIRFLYSFISLFLFLLFIYNYKKFVYSIKNDNVRINKYSFFCSIYKKEEKKLEESKINTLECLKKYKDPEKRRGECYKYRITLPSYKKIPYKEVYKEYRGGYNAIIEPAYQRDIEVIVAIPIAPPMIDGRIVARRTYMKVKKIDGLYVKYIFITGLIPEKIYSYNFSLLAEEAKIFDDILVFDMINTYYNITLLLMSMHKWIIEKYPKIKYFIRCNLDAVFIPRRIIGLLNKDYDVISQIGRHERMKINYPQGFFYIFSISA